MLEAVGTIAMTQSNPTESTMQKADHLLQYASRFPNNGIIFEASDMRLTAQADASYQSVPGSRSKLGGAFYFANNDDPPSTNNGLFAAISNIIPVVCSGAAEAEYAALYKVGQDAYFYKIVAEGVGYPQGPTPLYTDNMVAQGIANRTIKIKRSKSIEKSFHWIRDRVDLGDFVVLRVPTEENIADFFTKSLPRARHIYLRSRIVNVPLPVTTKLKHVHF